MARQTYEDWIPVESDSSVIKAIAATSAVDALATHVPMSSDTKQIPRMGDWTVGAVAKGDAYVETTSTNDYIELIARKVGGIKRIAEEDLTDTTVGMGILDAERLAAARTMARFFDNATLATSAAANGTTVLYTSVYRALRTTNAASGYTADANRVTVAASEFAAATPTARGKFSSLLAAVEASDWVDENNLVGIAHPAWKGYMRNVVDANGRPMWDEGSNTLFGTVPIRWTKGARVSATNTATPTGNPLFFIGDPTMLKVGDAPFSPQIASPNPGFALQRAREGIGFTTDEAYMKAAMRRAFAIGHELSWAVLEYTG